MKRIWLVPLTIIVLVGVGALGYYYVTHKLPDLERWVMSVSPSAQTPDEQKTLASLTTLDDHPFYQMTFYGDYTRYLEMKRKFYWAMSLPKPHCSSFAALNSEGHAILGYNNDGTYYPIILIYTDPPNGYASLSISMIGGAFPFFSKTSTPFDSDRARSLLLYAPYALQTGMNEMGLAMSTMTDPSGEWQLDPHKDTLGAAEARRFVLDHAKDVEDAITLLSQYNVSYKGTSVSHLLLADRAGHSALIEWVRGEMKIMRNEQPWQASTNFRVYGAQDQINADIARYQAGEKILGDSLGNNRWRYVTAWETLRKANGLLSPDQSMDLLSEISIEYRTQYSIVYDLVTGDVQVVTERNYDHVYHYQLAMK
jgi:hypothetical protein